MPGYPSEFPVCIENDDGMLRRQFDVLLKRETDRTKVAVNFHNHTGVFKGLRNYIPRLRTVEPTGKYSEGFSKAEYPSYACSGAAQVLDQDVSSHEAEFFVEASGHFDSKLLGFGSAHTTPWANSLPSISPPLKSNWLGLDVPKD
jgi:hypothetical protein